MASRPDPKAAEALFEEVLERDAKWLQTMAHAILWDRQAAEEVVQDACMRLWEAITTGQVGEDCGGWLRVVTGNLAKDRQKLLSRSLEETMDKAYLLTCEDPTPEEKEDLKKFRTIVAALPAQQRKAFELTFMAGLSNQEAAEALGCSDESARRYARMARDRLKALVPADTRQNIFSLAKKDLRDNPEKPPDSISHFDGPMP